MGSPGSFAESIRAAHGRRLASLADRGISIANRLGNLLDATEESCRAEQHGTNRVGLATAKSSIPTKLAHAYGGADGAVHASWQY
jgi:hypothetical protein